MAKKDKLKAKEARPQAQVPEGWPPLVGLTVAEAAASLRCDTKTVRTAIKEGGLPARMVGRGYRIDPDALRRWIASGRDGHKISPSADEIKAEFARAAEADRENPDLRGFYAGDDMDEDKQPQ